MPVRPQKRQDGSYSYKRVKAGITITYLTCYLFLAHMSKKNQELVRLLTHKMFFAFSSKVSVNPQINIALLETCLQGKGVFVPRTCLTRYIFIFSKNSFLFDLIINLCFCLPFGFRAKILRNQIGKVFIRESNHNLFGC